MDHSPTEARPRDSCSTGFTLIEILVATVVIAVAAIGTATTLMSTNRISLDSASRSQVESAIDEDVANIREAAYNYTYCSGAYTITGATCNSVGPGQEDYYFPDSVAQPTWATDFADDCNDGTLSNALISAINGGSSSLNLSSAASGLGITRSTAVLDSTAGSNGEKSHDIRITYNYDGAVARRVLITPTAAAWCP